QLLTRSKIFSAAATAFGAPPDAQASAVDIALPGTLPVLNRAAVEHAIRFGLAVGATINRRSIFARKNYFYPDLPKGYQISQYESPIVQGGSLRILAPHLGNESEKTIRLTRAHLEEDAGKSLHEMDGLSGIDLNRAGTPLLEIVSRTAARSSRKRGSMTPNATRPARCAPRRTRRTTAISPIPICCRWWSQRRRSRASARRCRSCPRRAASASRASTP